MSTIKGIRRKKSTLSEVKLLVIGAQGVGKTALTVRFLTKRYIGEYDHQAESKYKHEGLVDGEPILVEVLDTCPTKVEDGNLCTVENILWADGLLLVYSIIDKPSFVKLVETKRKLLIEHNIPIVLVASKADLLHMRKVTPHQGQEFAREMECPYFEVSAAENPNGVYTAFQELCRQVMASRRRGKQSLLDRMLGSKSSRNQQPKIYLRGKSDSALP